MFLDKNFEVIFEKTLGSGVCYDNDRTFTLFYPVCE